MGEKGGGWRVHLGTWCDTLFFKQSFRLKQTCISCPRRYKSVRRNFTMNQQNNYEPLNVTTCAGDTSALSHMYLYKRIKLWNRWPIEVLLPNLSAVFVGTVKTQRQRMLHAKFKKLFSSVCYILIHDDHQRQKDTGVLTQCDFISTSCTKVTHTSCP